MIDQFVHEIRNPFDVDTPLGHGMAMFMMAGSVHSNPQFLVRLYGTGDMRVFDMIDLRVYGNPTTGEPLVPPKLETKKRKP